MTGFCEHCKDKTCILCKTYKHEGQCRLQAAVGELKQMSLANKWATCYRCNATVEKRGDCDHMTCVCGAEFCCQCSAKWKTCACYHTEFLFDGMVNANFRAAHPEITSESQIVRPGKTGEQAQPQETEEAAALVRNVDSDMEIDHDTEQAGDTEMETEQDERAHQPADVEMEFEGLDTVVGQSEAEEQSSKVISQTLSQSQATATQPNPAVRQHFRRPHVPFEGDEAARIIEATTVALSRQAPQPGPQFPKRNWACLHNDYHAIHHGGPFNCADCSVIQSAYILQCKRCRIHLCVRCAELYKDFDWWRDGPPRGRSKPSRSQTVREDA